MKRFIAKIAAVVLPLVTVLAVAFAVFSAPAPQSLQAEEMKLYRNVTLWQGLGTTAATTNSTPLLTVFWGSADCYAVYGAGTAVVGASFTTATLKLQSSPDNTNWADIAQWPLMITPTVALSRTVLYGNYTRVFQTAGNTTALTTTVACKLIQTNN